MKMVKLRDLPNWPPPPGGAYDGGTLFPVATEVVINEIFPVIETMVTFRGESAGYPHSFHFRASSEKIASRIQTIISANLGHTVAELGEFEIVIDEGQSRCD
jgi:hypothetical protein